MPLTIDKETPVIKITGTTAADTEIIASDVSVFVKFVRWYNPTSAGHLANITDGNGKPVIAMNAESANDTQMWPIYTSFHGLRCDNLDSGDIYIYRT